MTTYATTYWHCYEGTLTGGPNAGLTLAPGEYDVEWETEEECLQKAQERAAIIDGRIRCYTRQYHERKPSELPANGEWRPALRHGRGYGPKGHGFLIVWLS